METSAKAIQSKRDRLAQAFHATGMTRLIGSLPKRSSLIVLNYHRIGDVTTTLYDSGVFSATEEEFDGQLRFLKSHFNVVGLQEAVEIATGRAKAESTAVLITFDDGYLDNYQLAFPILRSHNLSATFFLATSFVGTTHLPWWDQIAYLTKTSKASTIHMSYPYAFEVSLQDKNSAVKHLLDVYKSPSVQEPQRFLDELQENCTASGANMPTTSDRIFLDWKEAKEMIQGGMFIGSHTHSHRLLGKLSEQEQREELSESKTRIERELNISCKTLAYPVGKRTTFSAITKQALKETGYDAAFSFYGGINKPGESEPFDIKRVPVEAGTLGSRFELQLNLAAASRSYWF